MDLSNKETRIDTDLLHTNIADSSIQTFQQKRRKVVSKTVVHQRWRKATWYAMQEARRRREEDLQTSEASNKPLTDGAKTKGSYNNSNSLATVGETAELSVLRKLSLPPPVQNILQACVLLSAILGTYLVDVYVITTNRFSTVGDAAVFAAAAACFAVLLADWTASLALRPGFLFSAHMWTQALGTLALLPDLLILAALLSGSEASPPLGWPAPQLFSSLLSYGRTARVLRVLSALKPVIDSTRALKTWAASARIRPEPPAPPPIRRSRASRNLIPHAARGSFYGSFHGALGAALGSGDSDDEGIERALDSALATQQAAAALLVAAVGVGATFLLADPPEPRGHTMLALLEAAAAAGGATAAAGNGSGATVVGAFIGRMAANGEDVMYLRLLGQDLYGSPEARHAYRKYPSPEACVVELGGGSGGGEGGSSALHFSARRGVVAECRLRVAASTALLGALALASLWLAGVLHAVVVAPMARIVGRLVDLGRFPHQQFNRLLVHLPPSLSLTSKPPAARPAPSRLASVPRVKVEPNSSRKTSGAARGGKERNGGGGGSAPLYAHGMRQ